MGCNQYLTTMSIFPRPQLIAGINPSTGQVETVKVVDGVVQTTGGGSSGTQNDNNLLTSILNNTNNIPTKGQKTSDNSLPIVIASDQSGIPITSNSLLNIDTDLGNFTDTVASSDVGNFSLISLFKRLLQSISILNSLTTVSNTNTANIVVISNKLPSTLVGDRLKVDGSGVSQPINGSVSINNLPDTQPVSALSLPLPVGAATAANQTTAITSLVKIDNGLGTPSDTVATSDTGTFNIIALVKRILQSLTISNTYLADIATKLMPAGNTTVYIGTSAGDNLKASAGRIYSLTCSNSGTTTAWFQLFDKATAPDLDDVPIRSSLPIYANDGFLVIGQDVVGGSGIPFNIGVTWGISTTRKTYTPATAGNFNLTMRWS
jgi:hypothetical protein